MKRLLAIALIVAGTSASAGEIAPPTPTTVTNNDPSVFLGLTWTFGGSSPAQGAGIGLKVLSTNKRDAGALAAGVTYNFDGTIGCDVGAAYNFDDATLTAGWDFCKSAPQIGLGGTKKPDTTTYNGGDDF